MILFNLVQKACANQIILLDWFRTSFLILIEGALLSAWFRAQGLAPVLAVMNNAESIDGRKAPENTSMLPKVQ